MDQCGNRLRGPPGGLWYPYQKYCFDAAFVTPGHTNLVSCVDSYGTTSKHCQANNGCALDGRNMRHGGRTLPADFTPYAVSQLSQAQGAAMQGAQTAGQLQCKAGLIETWHDGQRNVMCPVSVAENVSRNCTNALKSVWQCDRFLAQGDRDGYNKCRAMEQCFQYNIQTPDGLTVPVAVKANDMCMAAATAALQQVAPQCVNGLRPMCATMTAWEAPHHR